MEGAFGDRSQKGVNNRVSIMVKNSDFLTIDSFDISVI